MKASTKLEYEQRVLRVQKHIETSLAEELQPQELASVAGFSLHHFHRVFRGLTGESVTEYGRRLRLERAARALRSSKMSVLDVALEAGYQSHEAFTRAFRRRFGLAPSEFRSKPIERLQAASVLGPRLKVTLRDEPTRVAVSMRHTGPYSGVGQLWQRFMTWVAQTQLELRFTGQPQMYAVVFDDPDVTPTEKLRYDACLELQDPEQELPEGPVARVTVEGGRYAVVIHEGSYDELAESYIDLIGRWFPQSGYVPAPSPVIERYLNSPELTPESELRTEICVLIDERGWVGSA